MWHCCSAIFSSLMRNWLTSLTVGQLWRWEKSWQRAKIGLVFFPPLPIFKGLRNELIKACFVIFFFFPFTERMSFPCFTYKCMFRYCALDQGHSSHNRMRLFFHPFNKYLNLLCTKLCVTC